MSNPQITHHIFCFLEIFSCEGGIQSYVKDILNGYQSLAAESEANLQADVLLLRDSPNGYNPYPSDQLKFHYLKTPSAKLGRLKLAATLLKLLLIHRPQQVFCGHINLVPLVQTLCIPLGIPYTVLTYGKEAWEPLSIQYQQGLKQANQIWTISRYSRDRICQTNHLEPQKFTLLPCMVDGNQFMPGKKPTHLVERYHLENVKVLMTVARLWPGDLYKGVDVTIRALPRITQVFPDVKYLVIGRGEDQPRLAKLAEDLGMADRVVFAGFIPTEELITHYQVADAYVMPSQEGFGIVYLEAMACGVPVVAGDNDGSADPLQDGKLGWRVPYRDPEAVAAACIEIFQGKDQRCQGQWLREEALAGFGQEYFKARLRQLLNF